MTNLRERLQAGDPANTAAPLGEHELDTIRRAMAAVQPESRGWPIVAGFALAASVLVAAVLLWPQANPAPAPRPVATGTPASAAQVLPAPTPVVAEVQSPRPRRAVPPPPPPAEPAQVKEIRFVTASGTQILWTVRSSEEGA